MRRASSLGFTARLTTIHVRVPLAYNENHSLNSGGAAASSSSGAIRCHEIRVSLAIARWRKVHGSLFTITSDTSIVPLPCSLERLQATANPTPGSRREERVHRFRECMRQPVRLSISVTARRTRRTLIDRDEEPLVPEDTIPGHEYAGHLLRGVLSAPPIPTTHSCHGNGRKRTPERIDKEGARAGELWHRPLERFD